MVFNANGQITIHKIFALYLVVFGFVLIVQAVKMPVGYGQGNQNTDLAMDL